MPNIRIDLVANKVTSFKTQHRFFLILDDGGSPVNIKRRTKTGAIEPLDSCAAGFGLEVKESSENYYDFVSATNKTIFIYSGNDKATYVKPAPTQVGITGTVAISNFPVNQGVQIVDVNGNPVGVSRFYDDDNVKCAAEFGRVNNSIQTFSLAQKGTLLLQNLDPDCVLRVMPFNNSGVIASPAVGFRVEPMATFEFAASIGGLNVCLETPTNLPPLVNNFVYIVTNVK